MSMILEEHREYLSDRVRVAAFRQAIGEVVAPGSVVLDLASGSGILGLMACEAGAARVYAVEVGGVVEIARAVAAANGFGDRVVAIQGMASTVSLPERVDTIVFDQLGHFGFESGLLEHGVDARVRFLRPGGTMLPARVDLFVAPIESAEAAASVEFWSSRPAALDFSEARRWAANTRYPTALQPSQVLGPPALAASLDMQSVAAGPLDMHVSVPVTRRGVLHGIGGWFSARLSPSVRLTNAPEAPERINRRNAFLPIDCATIVQPGDEIAIRVHVAPAAMVMTWVVEVRRDGARVARFRQSTLNSELVTRDDLRRTNPAFTPTLTPHGAAGRLVLALCDGRRTVAEVERSVFERHPDLFASLADAQRFVSEIVTRYAD